MPELPDVEAFRRYLETTSLRREVTRLRVHDPTALQDVTRQRLARALKGRRLVETRRHGKHLFVAASGADWLVLHFGMTGRLEYGDGRTPDHTRVTFEFADGSRLAYVDMRRLGFVTSTRDPDEYVESQQLGPDALSVSAVDLRDLLRSRRGAIKSALMDQTVVAGIGNIYSDEILFQARIDPRATAAGRRDTDYWRLHRQVGRVLTMAADRDADPVRLPDSWLLPHREDGAPCPRGRGQIRKFRMSGRGGFFCPSCQTS
ncbi:MAG TPA: DNA-formamidopyrimidine glycosylase family protein [Nocardioidaceae bacterium]|nr:DNA-formamidopyrimidine glycosylase family protein [Nocardioidaceae bacterium]